MRGRGEKVERLAAERLAGRRVLLFKPGFAISTAWAYGRVAARGSDYVPAATAEAQLVAWRGGTAPAEELLSNNMEPAAFEKYPALPVLLAQLRAEFGLAPHLSGSGSACFALLSDNFVTVPVADFIRERWGPAAFIQEARVL
jgi:4-diphosphocytidyl-2-C-methyl-D-erythritol kinase